MTPKGASRRGRPCARLVRAAARQPERKPVLEPTQQGVGRERDGRGQGDGERVGAGHRRFDAGPRPASRRRVTASVARPG
jgi:antitoxin (DNA-binding transcriptional repressor) of toxin-antitoxin stability system